MSGGLWRERRLCQAQPESAPAAGSGSSITVVDRFCGWIHIGHTAHMPQSGPIQHFPPDGGRRSQSPAARALRRLAVAAVVPTLAAGTFGVLGPAVGREMREAAKVLGTGTAAMVKTGIETADRTATRFTEVNIAGDNPSSPVKPADVTREIVLQNGNWTDQFTISASTNPVSARIKDADGLLIAASFEVNTAGSFILKPSQPLPSGLYSLETETATSPGQETQTSKVKLAVAPAKPLSLTNAQFPSAQQGQAPAARFEVAVRGALSANKPLLQLEVREQGPNGETTPIFLNETARVSIKNTTTNETLELATQSSEWASMAAPVFQPTDVNQVIKPGTYTATVELAAIGADRSITTKPFAVNQGVGLSQGATITAPTAAPTARSVNPSPGLGD